MVHRSEADQWTEAGRDFAASFEVRENDRREMAHARFQIVKLLARGGLGEVYVAHDEEVGRTVALKVMHTEVLRNGGLRTRFLRESEINGNLEHPGIIPVYGKGCFQDGRRSRHAACRGWHTSASDQGVSCQGVRSVAS